MRKQTKASKTSPPLGGRRNHSRFAPFYEEICRMRARRLTWREIADELSAKAGEKLDRTALWKMWDNRQRGAVRMEYLPAPSPLQKKESFPPVEQAAPFQLTDKMDELLGVEEATPPPKVVLKVRPGKVGNRPDQSAPR